MKILGKIATLAVASSMAMGVSVPVHAGSDNYLGEIMPNGYNFCPRGTTLADGKLLSISQNTALFSLYGTTYGGDGRTTFAVPDLRGRVVMHSGRGPGLADRRLGSRGGSETNTLTVLQMPSHNHVGNVLTAHTAPADTKNPKGNAFARSGSLNYENDEAPSTSLTDAMFAGTAVLANAGGNQSHNNMSPYIVINYCAYTVGSYPSRS